MRRITPSSVVWLLTICASASSLQAQDSVAVAQLRLKADAIANAILARRDLFRDSTVVSACGIEGMLGIPLSSLGGLSSGTQTTFQTLVERRCIPHEARTAPLDINRVVIERFETPNELVATVSFHAYLQPTVFRRETFELRMGSDETWRTVRHASQCCFAAMEGARVNPSGGLIVDVKERVPGPWVIVDGKVVVISARDSVLASLKDVLLISIEILPAGEDAQRIYGSNGAQGVVILTTERQRPSPPESHAGPPNS